MNDFSAITKEYCDFLNLHRKIDFCHSIDKKEYDKQCKSFFSNNENKKLEIQLADESLSVCKESENQFLLWLNKE